MFLSVCSPYKHRRDCVFDCGHCKDGRPCSTENGSCPHGCEDGWTGASCSRGYQCFNTEQCPNSMETIMCSVKDMNITVVMP
jgi:hypothetical protein